MRIGQGLDVHRLIPGSGIVVGGVPIAADFAVEAHSDGDVVIHALCDALLGSLALGDIGTHFPDTDERYRNISSVELLRAVVKKVKDAGWQLVNMDSTVVLERPALAPHIDSMREVLAQVLQVEISALSIKATRAEGLGALGRMEGIAAWCTVLVDR